MLTKYIQATIIDLAALRSPDGLESTVCKVLFLWRMLILIFLWRILIFVSGYLNIAFQY